MTKTINEPETIPGNDSGTNTVRNACASPAPRVRAAGIRSFGMHSIDAKIGNTMNGNSACVIPTVTPSVLRISDNGSSMMPVSSSALLMMPVCCSHTVHAYVRTSRLVKNGNNTRIVNRTLSLGLARYITYAYGYAITSAVTVTITAVRNVVTSERR